MNKLHTALLATVLCSIAHGLVASEEAQQQKVFFDKPTQDRFTMAAQFYGCGYGVAWGILNTYSIGNILIYKKKEQSLMHRKWTWMPEEYLKYPNGSSKVGNIFKSNSVISKTLLKTVPKTLPLAVITAVIYDGYQKSIGQ